MHLFFQCPGRETSPTQMALLTPKLSQVVTVRLLQTEICEVDCLPSVVGRDMQAGKKKVAVQNMVQEKLHSARGRAAEGGVTEGGFGETLAVQSTEAARITAQIDATGMKIEERALTLNKRLRELTEAQAALDKEDDVAAKKPKGAPVTPGDMSAAAAAAEEVVESITILVDQQDRFSVQDDQGGYGRGGARNTNTGPIYGTPLQV